MTAGRLIVIEGLDGAGTTTQARRLVAHLGQDRAHLTREPSDGPIGKLILRGAGGASGAGGADATTAGGPAILGSWID